MHNSELHTLLYSFAAIGLHEMDGVSLMNRLETKYVFSASKLPYILDNLSGRYKVLEIEKKRTFPYHTTYLDTPDYFFYTQQVRGKLNRHKIRYRVYESTGLSFLEIKKKTNKNRTIKWRIQNRLSTSCPDSDASLFIKEYIPYNLPEVRSVLINEFSRITLVGIESHERITLDFNLSFTGYEGRKTELPFLAIAELKRIRHSCQSPISIIMKQVGIQPNRFSKYCIGSALIRNMPRKNTLKSNLLLINKIENEYNSSSGT